MAVVKIANARSKNVSIVVPTQMHSSSWGWNYNREETLLWKLGNKGEESGKEREQNGSIFCRNLNEFQLDFILLLLQSVLESLSH